MKPSSLYLFSIFTVFAADYLKAQTNNLVQDGGFEQNPSTLFASIPIAYWNTNFAYLNEFTIEPNTVVNGFLVHSGANSFAETVDSSVMNPNLVPIGYLSQNLTTHAGESYRLNFFLENFPLNNSAPLNTFQVIIGGKVVFTSSNIPLQKFASNSYTFTSTGPLTLLEFGLLGNQLLILDDISVTPILGSIPGLTSNQQSIAENLDNSPAGSLAPIIENIPAAASISTIQNDLEELSPEKLQIFQNIATDNFDFLAGQMDDHLASVRDGQIGIDTSGLHAVDPTVPSALGQIAMHLYGGDSNTSNDVKDVTDVKEMTPPEATNQLWSAFISGNVILSDLNSDPDVSDGNYTTGNITAGADYRIDKNWLVGGLFDYSHTDASLDNYGSKAKVDSYSPGVYGSYIQKDWYVNGLFTYNRNEYSENRAIPFLGNTASAKSNGNQYDSTVDLGYEFRHAHVTYGPIASLQYVHLDQNGFTETGAGVASLAVNSQSTDSLRSRIGGQIRCSFDIGSVVLTPHVSASWQHEYLNSSHSIVSQFSGPGTTPFSVTTTNQGADAALIDAGLDAKINKALNIYLDYQSQAGQSTYFGQSAQAGAKVSF